MKIVSNGKELEIPIGARGPAGPDGSPIGTIISFLGLTEPKDYLICDGTAYNIADYPALAEFFREQFGTSNHFGGDGSVTFSVPDFRNLFLRGYHGGGEEQLSGEVGEKQEPTKIPQAYAGDPGITLRTPKDTYSYPLNVEMQERTSGGSRYSSGGTWKSDTIDANYRYATRPINVAVLYCIKAVESNPSNDSMEVYDDQERVIGTWFGKPLYQRSYHPYYPSSSKDKQYKYAPAIPDLDEVVSFNVVVNRKSGIANPTPFSGSFTVYPVHIKEGAGTNEMGLTGGLYLFTNSDYCVDCYYTVTIKYTKTTDRATIELPTA